MMIKHILDNLNKEQHRQLMYAFEHNLSQIIALPHDAFIGVNIKNNKALLIEESAGIWAYGKIKFKSKELL